MSLDYAMTERPSLSKTKPLALNAPTGRLFAAIATLKEQPAAYEPDTYAYTAR